MRVAKTVFSAMMTVVSLAIASIPAFGIVMRNDIIGRVIFGAVWVLVGISWLAGFFHSER